jgi:hypothetical protein
MYWRVLWAIAFCSIYYYYFYFCAVVFSFVCVRILLCSLCWPLTFHPPECWCAPPQIYAHYFFLVILGLNAEPTPWAVPPALFYEGCFWDRVLQTICLGWLWTVILLISTSWVARIIGVSHQHVAAPLLYVALSLEYCVLSTLLHSPPTLQHREWGKQMLHHVLAPLTKEKPPPSIWHSTWGQNALLIRAVLGVALGSSCIHSVHCLTIEREGKYLATLPVL